jgi:hypothetical protein
MNNKQKSAELLSMLSSFYRSSSSHHRTFFNSNIGGFSGFFNLFRINKYSEINHGKKGAPSEVILVSTPTQSNIFETLIKADGGLGGKCGIGIRTFIATPMYTHAYSELSTFMRFESDVLTFVYSNFWDVSNKCVPCDYAFNYTPQFSVPGGGSSVGSSMSKSNIKKIFIGSPGAPGIAMGNVIADIDYNSNSGSGTRNRFPTRQGYPKISHESKKRNTAPPQKWEENNELPNLYLPYGHAGIGEPTANLAIQLSNEKPSYPSPTGGGGGIGRLAVGMDDRLLSSEGSIDVSWLLSDSPSETMYITNPSLNYTKGNDWRDIIGNYQIPIGGIEASYKYEGFGNGYQQPIRMYFKSGFPNDEIYDDYFKVRSIKLNQSTTLGEGGKFISSDILIDETDTDNVRHIVKLGKGGNGGYDVSNNPFVNQTIPGSPEIAILGYPETILPEEGNSNGGYGGGGGGGASTYTANIHYDNGTISTKGQNGAKGGDGVIVVIFESLDLPRVEK